MHDGTYIADYKFISGAGELDECNGLTIDDGTYAYIITKEFPFVPRCWRGLPDRTFKTVLMVGKRLAYALQIPLHQLQIIPLPITLSNTSGSPYTYPCLHDSH